MELLYVWIKEYKNIKEQGFNFSPKWRFHYDPASGNLDMEDRQNKVIDNFFGEHISNVTAIVGENGSGKSNLLEFIMKKFYSLTVFWDEPFIVIIFHEGKVKLWKYADLKLIGTSLSSFIIRDFKMLENVTGFNGIRGENEFDNIHCVYYANSFTGNPIFEDEGRNQHFYDESTDGIIHRLKRTNKKIKTEETEETEETETTFSYSNFELHRQIKFIGEGGANIVKSIKLPDYLKISPRYSAKSILIELALKNRLYEDVSEAISNIENHFNNKGFGNKLYSFLLLPALYEYYTTRTNGEEMILYLNRELQNNKEYTFQDITGIDSIGLITYSEIIELVKWAENNLSKYFDPSTNELKIPLNTTLAFDFLDNIRFINYQFTYPFEFGWDFANGDKNVSLSTGETSLLGLFSRLYSLRWRLLQRSPVFVFIDEGELGLHPNWQKQLIKLLLDYLPNLWGFNDYPKGNIQIIFTTHSPLLLSDLPKENVLFLKKGDDGNCQVVDGLNDMKQTFGANIHTLLSDGFFMDGLMGDFAKEKIDKVIRYLNNELSNNEHIEEAEAEKIISMIGEPILKRHLEQQFQYKKQNREIQELKEELVELKKQIKKSHD